MGLAAAPGHWPVGRLQMACAAHCLPPTRLPPSQQEYQGTKAAACTKYLCNNHTGIWKCQNCPGRRNPWEQAWGAEESHPLRPTVCYKADLVWLILKHLLPSETEMWGITFFPFSFALWFLLKALKKVCLDSHCRGIPNDFPHGTCQLSLPTCLLAQCRESFWCLGLNQK